jgi:hypothetical protein
MTALSRDYSRYPSRGKRGSAQLVSDILKRSCGKKLRRAPPPLAVDQGPMWGPSTLASAGGADIKSFFHSAPGMRVCIHDGSERVGVNDDELQPAKVVQFHTRDDVPLHTFDPK